MIYDRLNDADMFKRLLILSVCERATDAAMVNDRKRPKAKACGTSVIAAGGKG